MVTLSPPNASASKLSKPNCCGICDIKIDLVYMEDVMFTLFFKSGVLQIFTFPCKVAKTGVIQILEILII